MKLLFPLEMSSRDIVGGDEVTGLGEKICHTKLREHFELCELLDINEGLTLEFKRYFSNNMNRKSRKKIKIMFFYFIM